MSDSVGGVTNSSIYGTLGTLIANSGTVRQQLDTLTSQASSGYVSSSYAGLGSGTSVSLSVSPLIQHQTVWSSNIDSANSQMAVAQNALTELSSIATTFYADTTSLNGLDPGVVANIAANARSALKQVAGLLDTQDNNTYVFSGQDTANAPIDNPDGILGSSFYSQINAQVTSLGGTPVGTIISNTLSIASSDAAGTTPFSAYLSSGTATLQSVQVGDQQTATVGILANANAYVTSTGSSTTGSYTRDLMRSLATLGSMTDSMLTNNNADFNTLLSDTRSSLQGVVTALNGDAGVMGDKQTALKQSQTELSNMSTALTQQVSFAQDVDMTKTLSNLTQTQTRLQASYQLIAGMENLSLVSYLPS